MPRCRLMAEMVRTLRRKLSSIAGSSPAETLPDGVDRTAVSTPSTGKYLASISNGENDTYDWRSRRTSGWSIWPAVEIGIAWIEVADMAVP